MPKSEYSFGMWKLALSTVWSSVLLVVVLSSAL